MILRCFGLTAKGIVMANRDDRDDIEPQVKTESKRMMRRMWQVARNSLAFHEVKNGLAGLAIVWMAYLLMTSQEFGFVSELPDWLRSRGLFGTMAAISALLLLVLSLRSLLPAILFWLAGIAVAIAGGHQSTSVLVFCAAVTFSVIYCYGRSDRA